MQSKISTFILIFLLSSWTSPVKGAEEIVWPIEAGLNLSAANFIEGTTGVVVFGNTWPRQSVLEFFGREGHLDRVEIPDMYINRVVLLDSPSEPAGLKFFACGSVGSGKHEGFYVCRKYSHSERNGLHLDWDSQLLPPEYRGESTMIDVGADGRIWGAIAQVDEGSVRLIVGAFPDYDPVASFSVERDLSKMPPAISEEFPEFEFLDESAGSLMVAILWGGFVDVMSVDPQERVAVIRPSGAGDRANLQWVDRTRHLWMRGGSEMFAYHIPADIAEPPNRPSAGAPPALESVQSVPGVAMQTIRSDGSIAILQRNDERTDAFRVRISGNALVRGDDFSVASVGGVQPAGKLAGSAYVTVVEAADHSGGERRVWIRALE